MTDDQRRSPLAERLQGATKESGVLPSAKEHFQQLWEAAEKIMGEQVKPRVLVGGKTGVGKSSLLNAVLGRSVFETGVIPTTKGNTEALWESRGSHFVVIDVPGLGEASATSMAEGGTYAENLEKLAMLDAHILLGVLKCDDRALSLEESLLKRLDEHPVLRALPVLIVVNQIDKMPPVRIWDPNSLNLKTPSTEKERNIRKYLDYVAGLPLFSPIYAGGRLLPVCAGEEGDDLSRYGIAELLEAIYDALPDAAKTVFARQAAARALREKEGKRLANRYAMAAAGAVAANFLPAADALLILPIQIAMIIHLGKLWEVDMTKSAASGLLTSLGASLAGRFTVQGVVSLFPGVKNFVGPPLAYSLTMLMGRAVNGLFSLGIADPTADQVREAAAHAKAEPVPPMSTS